MIELYSEYSKKEKRQPLICPSILSADFTQLGSDLDKINTCANWVHIDVMDGMYVPNISFGLPIVKAVKKRTKLPLDVHLMIEDPIRYIDDFQKAGADLIVVHAEACKHLHRVVQYIRTFGKNAGVAINPATPLNVLYEILPYVDLVLLMTVNPGFGGQEYISSMTKKVFNLRELMDKEKIDSHIQVDGGISKENIKQVFEAGANVIVAGSSVFKGGNPAQAIKEMKECAE